MKIEIEVRINPHWDLNGYSWFMNFPYVFICMKDKCLVIWLCRNCITIKSIYITMFSVYEGVCVHVCVCGKIKWNKNVLKINRRQVAKNQKFVWMILTNSARVLYG